MYKLLRQHLPVEQDQLANGHKDCIDMVIFLSFRFIDMIMTQYHNPQEYDNENKWRIDHPSPKTQAQTIQYKYDTLHLLHHQEATYLMNYINHCVGLPNGSIKLFKSHNYVVLTFSKIYLNQTKNLKTSYIQLTQRILGNGHGIKLKNSEQLDLKKQEHLHEFIVEIPESFINDAVAFNGQQDNE